MIDLDPALTRSAAPIGRTALCAVLLKTDARWPWLILVPMVAAAESLLDLSEAEAVTLSTDIRAALGAIAAEAGVRRTNVGMLGNVVAQLHVHVLGRWPGDPAWPGPVWGVDGKQAYQPATQAALAERLRTRMGAVAW